MDENRKARYERLLNQTREDINSIGAEIDRELAAVKERLAGLQNEKKVQLNVYSEYCQLLGVVNEFEEDDDDEDE